MINCLVIDDEQHAIDVLEHYIRETGILKLVASTDNPLTALAVLQDLPVDLIFLDIHMPQLSGIDIRWCCARHIQTMRWKGLSWTCWITW